MCGRLWPLMLVVCFFHVPAVSCEAQLVAQMRCGRKSPPVCAGRRLIGTKQHGWFWTESQTTTKSREEVHTQEMRAHRIEVSIAETLGDVILLARLIDFQIITPADADLNWPIRDLDRNRVALHQLLVAICHDHNLTLAYTPTGVELLRIPANTLGKCDRPAGLPVGCKVSQHRLTPTRSQCRRWRMREGTGLSDVIVIHCVKGYVRRVRHSRPAWRGYIVRVR